MPFGAPLSLLGDLYLYWDAKRAGRALPARHDLNPAEVRALLPHISLVDRQDGRFRYRLVGTEVAHEIGRDLTGAEVGFHARPAAYGAALQAVYARIFADARPLFSVGEYRRGSDAVHRVSRIILPLGEDGRTVNMVVLGRVARFAREDEAGAHWLAGATGRLCEVVEVGSLAELKALALAWEQKAGRVG